MRMTMGRFSFSPLAEIARDLRISSLVAVEYKDGTMDSCIPGMDFD